MKPIDDDNFTGRFKRLKFTGRKDNFMLREIRIHKVQKKKKKKKYEYIDLTFGQTSEKSSGERIAIVFCPLFGGLIDIIYSIILHCCTQKLHTKTVKNLLIKLGYRKYKSFDKIPTRHFEKKTEETK